MTRLREHAIICAATVVAVLMGALLVRALGLGRTFWGDVFMFFCGFMAGQFTFRFLRARDNRHE